MNKLILPIILSLLFFSQKLLAQVNPPGTTCADAYQYVIGENLNYPMSTSQTDIYLEFTPNQSVLKLEITPGDVPFSGYELYFSNCPINAGTPILQSNTFSSTTEYLIYINSLNPGTTYMLKFLTTGGTNTHISLSNPSSPPYFGACPAPEETCYDASNCYTDKLSNNGFSYFTVDPSSSLYIGSDPFNNSQICGWEHAGGQPTINLGSDPHVQLDNGTDAIAHSIASSSSTGRYIVSFKSKRIAGSARGTVLQIYALNSSDFSIVNGQPLFNTTGMTNPKTLIAYYLNEIGTGWEEHHFCVILGPNDPKDYLVFAGFGQTVLLDDIKMRGVELGPNLIADSRVGVPWEKYQTCESTTIGVMLPYPHEVDNNLMNKGPLSHFYIMGDFINTTWPPTIVPGSDEGLKYNDRGQTTVFTTTTRTYQIESDICGISQMINQPLAPDDGIRVVPYGANGDPVDYIFDEEETITNLTTQVPSSGIGGLTNFIDLTFVLTKDLRVDAGTRFLNCKIYALEGSRIITDPGDRLYLEDTEISSCSDASGDRPLWKGIEVHSSLTSPGHLRVTNSTISDAEIAVLVGKRDASGAILINGPEAGGAVRTYDATFDNNVVDIYAAPSTKAGTRLKFDNTTFNGNLGPVSGLNLNNSRVILDHVSTIEFFGCAFNYTHSDISESRGIEAINSSFLVQPNQNSVQNNFQGFETAVDTKVQDESEKGFLIDGARFFYNQKSVYAKGIRFLSITDAEFVIPQTNHLFDIHSPIMDHPVYGLKMEECVEYEVEDNVFRFFAPSPAVSDNGIGIVNLNDDNDIDINNEIYGNEFERLHTGIMVHGNHRRQTDNKGLQILCNEFDHNKENHIALRNFTAEGGIIYESYIAEEQGTPQMAGPNTMEPAGNVFFPNCLTPGLETDIYVEPAQVSPNNITYIHHDQFLSPPPANFLPGCYTTGQVVLQPHLNSMYNADPNMGPMSCPSRAMNHATSLTLMPYLRSKPEEGLDNVVEEETNSLKIYPNPVQNQVAIELSKNSKIQEIRLFDLLGKEYLVNYKQQTEKRAIVNTTSLAKGVYVITINLDNGTVVSRKLIKQ